MKKTLHYLLYALIFFLPAQVIAQIANHVVISQIYGGGGNTGAPLLNDYIELYNPTNGDVDMSGWSVQYQSATGTSAFSGQTAIPSGSIIKAHGYFLIEEQSGGSVGSALITPDLATTGTTNNFNMSSASGKVALCNNTTVLTGAPPTSTTNVVDFVGYGVVNYNAAFVLLSPTSNTGAAPTLTSLVADERLANSSSTATTLIAGGSDVTAGNGYYTGVNSADYVLLTTVNPHNSTYVTLIAPSVASLNFGTTQTVGTTSAAQTFTIAGVNTGGATVTVTGPFTVSTDGGTTYGTSKTITSAQLATTTSTTTAFTVMVKFTPTNGTAATGTVTIAATGATSQTVSLTGTGVLAATLTPSVSTLPFGNVNVGTTSVLSYTLAGANLGANNTTVAATAPYSLSKSSTGPFTATLSFTPTELSATPSPSVYVQFSPTATGAANGSITHTNTAVTTGPTVSVTGTGVVPVITAATSPVTTPASIDFGNQTISTSVTKSFTVSGANLITGGTTTVASTGNAAYTVSKTNGSGYASSITFSNAEMAANPTVYVQFLPTILGATPGTILCSNNGSGATSATVNLTGTSVAAPVPVLSINQSTLTAFTTTVGTTSTASNYYTITGANITAVTPITVTTAAPYQISKDGATNWTSSFGFTNTDFPTNTSTQKVYVRFSPTVPGPANGSAINMVTSGSTQTVTLTGTGLGVPLLTPTPTSLTFIQTVTTTSAAQSFSLEGDYLTAPSTVVTVAAPYQVSKDGSTNWGTSVSYTSSDFPPAGTATLNVYVRITPTVVAAGGVNNGAATITSTGATTQTVTLNGTGVALPVITPSTATVAFGNQSIAVASAGSTFSLTATNTTASTTLTTAAPFGLSKTSAGPYATSISYSPTEMATAQTVYVNFAPTTTTAFTGSISIATTNATSQTVALTGTGIPPPNVAPTLNPISNVTFCYTNAQQTIALSGISPGPETTQLVTVAASSNNPSLFSQLGILPLTATTAQLNYTIANGASGTATVTVTVHDNGGTANGGVDTYTQSFTVTVNPQAVVNITASNGGAALERGQTVTLTATGGTSYAWTANGDIVGALNGPSVTVRPGTLSGSPAKPSVAPFTYTVTATNASGCTTTQSYTVNTFNATKLVTSNIITPNGDGINDTWVIINIELYPDNVVKVFDKSGKIVFTQSGYLNTWDGTYNGAPLTQGTYTYVVDLGSGTKYSGYISIVR